MLLRYSREKQRLSQLKKKITEREENLIGQGKHKVKSTRVRDQQQTGHYDLVSTLAMAG